jgi:hypothetical protein
MLCHVLPCALYRQGSAHHALRVDLRRRDRFKAPLNCSGRLREPKDDCVEHGFGALTQGSLVQLADGIRGLGDDDIGTSLGCRQSTREVGKGVGGDHHARDATPFERGRDVATPRRARASVTGGSDRHIDALGEIIERASQGIDKPSSPLRQFSGRLFHDDCLQAISFRQ